MCRDPRNARPQLEYQQVKARNTIARAVEIGLLEKTERRYCGAVSLPNILRLGQLWQRVLPSESTYAAALSKREWPVFDSHMQP